MTVLTREQMRAYDAHAIEALGVPGLLLMENAGRGAAEVIAELIDDDDAHVLIICGTGNNGGDGFVIARHLLAAHHRVRVLLIGDEEKIAGDARVNFDALRNVAGFVIDDISALEVELIDATIIVDAMFGTGLTRPLAGVYAETVYAINQMPTPVVAVDMPSGIDADSGAILGTAIEAATTVTFGALKAGLLQGAGGRCAGDVQVVGLGVPDAAIIDKVGLVAQPIIGFDALLRGRPSDSHKYSAGSVLVIGGSRGKTGAALLCARAALRSGAGLATIATWPDAVDAVGARVTEVMTFELGDADAVVVSQALEKRSAVAIGPGLGLDERAKKLCDAVVLAWDGHIVVDADAITHFAGRAGELKQAQGKLVLTPHAGELSRLLGCTSAEVEAHRFDAVRRAAEATGATVVLKGAHTVVARGGDWLGEPLKVSLSSNAALATAGSGDVLAGIIAAMLCAKEAEPQHAACAGVYIHAEVADRWRVEHERDRGMLASDIIAGIGPLLSELICG